MPLAFKNGKRFALREHGEAGAGKRGVLLAFKANGGASLSDLGRADEGRTREKIAKAIGNGTLSFLMNIDPNERLTCYYLDETGTGEYHKLPVYIGDKYFKRTDYLELNTPRHLWKEQKRLNEEIWAERNGG